MAEGHDSIVIVSHGDACFAMRMWAAGMERNESNRAEELKKGPYISYCGVTCLELDVNGKIASVMKSRIGIGLGTFQPDVKQIGDNLLDLTNHFCFSPEKV
eukprot:UN19351